MHEQDRMPLLSALLGCAASSPAAFFTPGHKQGAGTFAPLFDAWGHAIFESDLPELPELDNLYAPEGAIASAQALAAEAFGADFTWFLVNGSTVGIMAAILAVGKPGDLILMPRTVHRSAIAGCILAGIEPIFITPPYNCDWQIPLCLTPMQVAAALNQFPSTKAVLLVSPTYEGVVADVGAIADICHQHQIPLLVDAAHGAHFGFHPDLPPSPLNLGADVVVQSTHKVLSALTQASMLHLKGDLVQDNRISRALQILQTSSPSYLLLASLDAARSQMAMQGLALMAQTLHLAETAKQGIARIPGLRVLESIHVSGTHCSLDATRLTLDVCGLGITGFAADDYLREHHQVVAELPLLRTLMFILSLGNQPHDIQRLLIGLTALAARQNLDGVQPTTDLHRLSQRWHDIYPETSQLPISLREAFWASVIQCPLESAIGRISAELICPYPPGIPVLLPGEMITEPAIAYLQAISSEGGTITGLQSLSLQTLGVISE
jgi:arginine decarboxylase